MSGIPQANSRKAGQRSTSFYCWIGLGPRNARAVTPGQGTRDGSEKGIPDEEPRRRVQSHNSKTVLAHRSSLTSVAAASAFAAQDTYVLGRPLDILLVLSLNERGPLASLGCRILDSYGQNPGAVVGRLLRENMTSLKAKPCCTPPARRQLVPLDALIVPVHGILFGAVPSHD